MAALYLSSLLKPPSSVDDPASFFTEQTETTRRELSRCLPPPQPTTGTCCHTCGCPACSQQEWPTLLLDPTFCLCTGPLPIQSCPSTDSLQQFFLLQSCNIHFLEDFFLSHDLDTIFMLMILQFYLQLRPFLNARLIYPAFPCRCL